MSRFRLCSLSPVVCVVLLVGPAARGQTPPAAFTGIAPLAGDSTTGAAAVSGDGSKVTGASFDASGVPEAYVFDVVSALAVGIGVPSGLTNSRGTGIDVDLNGKVHVAGYGTVGGSNTQAFYYEATRPAPFVLIPFLPGGSSATAAQLRCNNDSASNPGDPYVSGTSKWATTDGGGNPVTVDQGYRWKLSAPGGALLIPAPSPHPAGANSVMYNVAFRSAGTAFLAIGYGKSTIMNASAAGRYYSGDSVTYFQGYLNDPYTSSSQSYGRAISRNGDYWVGDGTFDGNLCTSHRQAWRVQSDDGGTWTLSKVIVAGPNGVAETTATSGDRQVRPVGASGLSPRAAVVEGASWDSTEYPYDYDLQTEPAGDDEIIDYRLPPPEGWNASLPWGVSNDGTVVAGWARLLVPAINAGSDGDCDTTAAGDDIQAFAVGTTGLSSNNAVIFPGPNGVIDTTPAAGDVLASCSWYHDGSRPVVPLSTAFVWDAVHGTREVRAVLQAEGTDMTGWVLTEVTGLSDDGTVLVGNGTYNGQARGWVATIPSLNPSHACCAADGSCTEVPRGLCAGVWHEGQTCGQVECPDLVGACCHPSLSTCIETTEAACTGLGRIWHGADSVCQPNPCAGGCCGDFHACTEVPQDQCAGTWTPGGCEDVQCCPDPFSDSDYDDDVDMVDFADFQRCLNSPGYPEIAEGCACWDADGNGMIDENDWSTGFLSCARGPGVTVDPACDNPQ